MANLKPDIYDLGFETIRLELSLHEKRCFMAGGVKNDVVPNTITYLIKKYKALDARMSHTTDPKKLTEMHDSGLRIIHLDYVPIWHEDALQWNKICPAGLFLHYVVFQNQEELNFYKLIFK